MDNYTLIKNLFNSRYFKKGYSSSTILYLIYKQIKEEELYKYLLS